MVVGAAKKPYELKKSVPELFASVASLAYISILFALSSALKYRSSFDKSVKVPPLFSSTCRFLL